MKQFSWILNYRFFFPPFQMISRIEYVHTKNFIHRDIKPDNFLMGIGRHCNKVRSIRLDCKNLEQNVVVTGQHFWSVIAGGNQLLIKYIWLLATFIFCLCFWIGNDGDEMCQRMWFFCFLSFTNARSWQVNTADVPVLSSVGIGGAVND